MTAYQPLDVRMADVVMPGEAVRWSGEAPTGLRFRGSDAFAIPFSLLWGGFAIFWESMVVTSGAPFFFRLWGIPFVLMGLYLIFGRFVVDAYLRAETSYAVTDRAAYIARTGLWPAVRRYADSALDSIEFQPAPNGAGTIRFLTAGANFVSAMYGWRLWNASPLDAFSDVPNARAVYALILEARSSGSRAS